MIRTSHMTDEQFSRFVLSHPVAGGKGDQIAKQNEELQLSFNKQLMGIFTKQFGEQSAVMQFIRGKMEPMINHPTGYSAPDLAAMRTQSTENAAQATKNAQQATQAAEAVRGGSTLPSGVNAQLAAENNVAGAQLNANTQNQITQADENLKQQNYWNAINVENGAAAQYNPLGYASGATSGAGAVSGLSQAFQASKQDFWSQAAGSLIGGVSSGIGTYLGGLKKP